MNYNNFNTHHDGWLVRLIIYSPVEHILYQADAFKEIPMEKLNDRKKANREKKEQIEGTIQNRTWSIDIFSFSSCVLSWTEPSIGMNTKLPEAIWYVCAWRKDGCVPLNSMRCIELIANYVANKISLCWICLRAKCVKIYARHAVTTLYEHFISYKFCMRARVGVFFFRCKFEWMLSCGIEIFKFVQWKREKNVNRWLLSKWRCELKWNRKSNCK